MEGNTRCFTDYAENLYVGFRKNISEPILFQLGMMIDAPDFHILLRA